MRAFDKRQKVFQESRMAIADTCYVCDIFPVGPGQRRWGQDLTNLPHGSGLVMEPKKALTLGSKASSEASSQAHVC